MPDFESEQARARTTISFFFLSLQIPRRGKCFHLSSLRFTIGFLPRAFQEISARTEHVHSIPLVGGLAGEISQPSAYWPTISELTCILLPFFSLFSPRMG